MQKQIIVLSFIGFSFFIIAIWITINSLSKLKKWISEKPIIEFKKNDIIQGKNFTINSGEYCICIYANREFLRKHPVNIRFSIKNQNNQIVRLNDTIFNWINISDFEMKYKIFVKSVFNIEKNGEYTLLLQNTDEIKDTDLIVIKRRLSF